MMILGALPARTVLFNIEILGRLSCRNSWATKSTTRVSKSSKRISATDSSYYSNKNDVVNIEAWWYRLSLNTVVEHGKLVNCTSLPHTACFSCSTKEFRRQQMQGHGRLCSLRVLKTNVYNLWLH